MKGIDLMSQGKSFDTLDFFFPIQHWHHDYKCKSRPSKGVQWHFKP